MVTWVPSLSVRNWLGSRGKPVTDEASRGRASASHSTTQQTCDGSTPSPPSLPSESLAADGLKGELTGPTFGGSQATSGPRQRSPASPANRIGLHVVHSPASGSKADIIFVHGLGGTSHMTWTKNKDVRLFWPGAFLPLEPDLSQARILTFGYNANVMKSPSQSSVLDFAKYLLSELKYAKDAENKDLKIGDTPLIFVAHSMGGLTIKEAYLQGQHDPHYSDIINAITAIIFMSTPHRGADLAETLNRIIQISFVSTPKAYISELARNSLTVQQINEQFRHVAPKLQIVSFYETRPTAIGPTKSRIMVVEKDSSVLGYPGEISKGLDADHNTVCKYESRQDPSYISVRNYLKSNIAMFLTTCSSRVPTSPAATNIDTRDLERLVHISEPPDTDYEYIVFRDRWVPGTSEWILEEDTFSRWLDDPCDSPKLLWIHGVPGSGKSVLSSFVVNHLTEIGKPCQYVFVRFGDHGKRSLGYMLSTLAFQVAQACPPFLRALSRTAGNLKLRAMDPKTIWQRVFRAVLFKQELSSPLYWVIDGLDECDGPRAGIKMLSEVLDSSMPIRILFTSRRTTEIELELKKSSTNPRFATIALENTSVAYRAYIQEELTWSDVPEFNERITQQLLDMACGSFLWLALTVERINNCHTEQAVEIALQELPPGMEDLYDRMAASIADQQSIDSALTASILSWVTCARRTLSVLELQEALEPEGRRVLSLQRSIGALCAGFVVIDNGGSVALVHKTAGEYLQRTTGTQFGVDKKAAHQSIFLRCVDCLTVPGLRGKVTRGQAPFLVGYAATSWTAHLACCNPAPEEVMDSLVKLLRSSAVLSWIHILAEERSLGALLQASSHLLMFSRKRKVVEAGKLSADRRHGDLDLIDGWAIELSRIVGKFSIQLLHQPDSIDAVVPPFCPANSMIRRQFARKKHEGISVSGTSYTQDWDDCLARLSLGHDYEAFAIVAQGPWIAVAANLNNSGKIIIYHADTHQKHRELDHKDRLRRIQINSSGNYLVSSGLSTTKVWNVASASCVTAAPNPAGRPRPQSMVFTNDDDIVLFGTEDRRLWSMSLSSRPETALQALTRITEARGAGGPVNSPSCMAVSPDGRRVALGYRRRALTVWEIEAPELLASSPPELLSSSPELMRTAHIVWHPDPQVPELFGLIRDLGGRVFKWHLDYIKPITYYVEASILAINHSGTLLALGDHHGNLKLLSTNDLGFIYHITTQDPVLGIAFSADDRQLYDVRTSYANVWEPDVLLKLAEPIMQLGDEGSDTGKALAEAYLEPSKALAFARVDPITALGGQNKSGFYCSGSLDGTVRLHRKSGSPLYELNRSSNRFSIQQIAWTNDGSHVCYADVCRTIFVDSVQHASDSDEPHVQRVFDTPTRMRDNIDQLLFHPKGGLLLVSSRSASVVLSLDEKAVIANWDIGGDTAADGRFARHPTNDDLLLYTRPWLVHVMEWTSLQKVATVQLGQGRNSYVAHGCSMDTHYEASAPELWNTSSASNLSVQNLLMSPSKRYLLIQSRAADDHTFVRLVHIDHEEPENQIRLSDVELPSALVHRLERPLGIDLTAHTPDALRFLDKNSWLCTWPIPRPTNRSDPTRNQEAGGRGISPGAGLSNSNIHAHYCLPGDWVSPECVAVMQMLGDGTLLCPRNGEVATVQCADLAG
ncbi:Uncharacterized protein TPAR_08652 [Tolypocladium paradoxum]|uniref:Uncharacterized protein n=1 Tax=Tolypocladium paradoxum TaxID=94208 RepID=A0A2S4KLR6_9HYPO|nr:Uncharacterized protein TPAR_08652 [Tolypocladium paradoxum]